MTDRNAWAEPGIFEVAAGVHRIPLPLPNDGLRAVNVYAIEDGDGLTLIDSGWALTESLDLLKKSLAQIGFELGDIRRFLVTHVHRDHYSQAVVVRRMFGSRVALGIGEVENMDEIIASRSSIPQKLITRLTVAGGAEILRSSALAEYPLEELDEREWSAPDDWLRHGDLIKVGNRTLTALATPGHTAGHVVFHDEAGGLLFSGDHILPTITPSIGFESAPMNSPLSAYLSSLALVAALGESKLLPAHGAVHPSTATRVRELQDHHKQRLEVTLAAVHAGAATAVEVSRQLKWTRHAHHFDVLNTFNQILAMNETLAHLEVLEERGAITVRTEENVKYFQ